MRNWNCLVKGRQYRFRALYSYALVKIATQKLIYFKNCLFGYDKTDAEGYRLSELKYTPGFPKMRSEFFGDQNMLKNECGFKLKNVTVQDSGKWFCEFVKWNSTDQKRSDPHEEIKHEFILEITPRIVEVCHFCKNSALQQSHNFK